VHHSRTTAWSWLQDEGTDVLNLSSNCSCSIETLVSPALHVKEADAGREPMSRSGKNLGIASTSRRSCATLHQPLLHPGLSLSTNSQFVQQTPTPATYASGIAVTADRAPHTLSTRRLRNREPQLPHATQLQREAPGIAPHATR
jgi:hypothetical protein